jgi:hypothetical protein
VEETVVDRKLVEKILVNYKRRVIGRYLWLPQL